MRSEDKKIKATAKDTHGLRLNLKSPENRQRYPPDATNNDLDAIQVISSEYEVVLPQLSSAQTSTPITTVPNVPPPPPFPPPGFLLKLPVVTDELCLPKIKNKYGAVSKTYIKKLSSIFQQHPSSNNNLNNLNNNSAKVINNEEDKEIDGKKVSDNDDDDIDEGRGSLSEKSVANNSNGTTCDKQIDDKSEKFNYHTKGVKSDMNKKNEIMKNKVTKNRELGETIGTFTLPRIALNKNGANYEEDIGFVECCAKSGGTGTTRSSIAPTNLPTANSHHHRTRRTSTSHYSTEKSGSSGYYGSNLYSAGGSSVDEHIYSEPVIIEHVEVHSSAGTMGKGSGIVNKERKCLASLNKSISCLENCLESKDVKKSLPEIVVESPGKTSNKEIPNSIVNRRKASLPRDGTIPRPVWPTGDGDDSLTNINLDAFNLKQSTDQLNESFNLIQLHTPKSEKRQSTFTNTDSGKGTSEGTEYMDLVDYHQTRNILVNIQSKLETLLEQHRMTIDKNNPFVEQNTPESDLERNIISLKNDLENYLTVMTEKSEQELRQFSDTMSKDSRIQTVTKAFDRSKYRQPNTNPITAYTCFSSQIKPPLSRKPSIEKGDFIMTCNDQINPFTATPCDTVIQIISDATSAGGSGDSSDSLNCDGNKPSAKTCNRHGGALTQMQKNLAFSQLINDSFNSSANKYGDDREKMLNEWHRDKPSIWEMYYGTNRYSSKIEQAMIREYKYASKCAMNVSYPSTRPESDFTLDMPRAEELREQMEKEKQFRSRCRLITYFLGLLIFLLTVMIVSLVLTRGKRMFGSML